MTEVTPAGAERKERGIAHRTFRHAGKVTSLEQAARERGQEPEQVVRSLVFRTGVNEFIMVLAPGARQVSWKRLRERMGQSRLMLATPDEVLQLTGYRIGTLSPMGLPCRMRILLDRKTLDKEEISIGAGEAGTGIMLSTADLLRSVPDAEIAELEDSA